MRYEIVENERKRDENEALYAKIFDALSNVIESEQSNCSNNSDNNDSCERIEYDE